MNAKMFRRVAAELRTHKSAWNHETWRKVLNPANDGGGRVECSTQMSIAGCAAALLEHDNGTPPAVTDPGHHFIGSLPLEETDPRADPDEEPRFEGDRPSQAEIDSATIAAAMDAMGIDSVEAARLFTARWPRTWFVRAGIAIGGRIIERSPTPDDAATILDDMAAAGGIWNF